MFTYALIKTVHHLAIALSLALFVLRWVGVLRGHSWPLDRRVRHASVGIDTVLLTAGVSLWIWGAWHPWHQPWLGSKLAWLVVYVLLGSWALKRARSIRGHLVFGLMAVATAVHMVGVAWHHHPAGWLLPLWLTP